MKSTTVARNYAQALLLAAEAHGMAAIERYGQLMDAVAGAVQADERISVALESPRVSKAVKAALLAQAREQYEQLLDRARKEIEGEKEKAILELRREAVDLSIAAASKLIEANLDSAANRRLVTEYLASLEAGGAGGRAR